MNHGELTTVHVHCDDGTLDIECVLVETRRVPKSKRRRILQRFTEDDGRSRWSAMTPANYRKTFNVEPWDGDIARAGRTTKIH